jgi:hypothetical protein
MEFCQAELKIFQEQFDIVKIEEKYVSIVHKEHPDYCLEFRFHEQITEGMKKLYPSVSLYAYSVENAKSKQKREVLMVEFKGAKFSFNLDAMGDVNESKKELQVLDFKPGKSAFYHALPIIKEMAKDFVSLIGEKDEYRIFFTTGAYHVKYDEKLTAEMIILN